MGVLAMLMATMMVLTSGGGLVSRFRFTSQASPDALNAGWIDSVVHAAPADGGALSALVLRSNELQVVTRNGAHEHVWTALPQDVTRSGSVGGLHPANATIAQASFRAEPLVDAFTHFQQVDSQCPVSRIVVQAHASWSGKMRITVACEGDSYVQSRIGADEVIPEASLGTPRELHAVLADLKKLVPPTGISQLSLVLAQKGSRSCDTSASWVQLVAGERYWVSQHRQCSANGASGYLPATAEPVPGSDSGEPTEHLFTIDQLNQQVLTNLVAATPLPTRYPPCDTINIGWRDDYGQIVLAARGPEGTRLYSLAGRLLGHG